MTTQSEKQRVIAEIIALQKSFITRQREGGVDAREYFAPQEDEELHGYSEQHARLATRLVDLAHAERGTSR